MARPSKLTAAQCEQFRVAHANKQKRTTMAKLCERFGISESSGYKVLDGSYVPRPNDVKRSPATVRQIHQPTDHVIGGTPSLFHPERRTGIPSTRIAEMRSDDRDRIMQLAEQLVAAKSAFVQALRAA